MTDEEAKPWMDNLQIQPGRAYNKRVEYAAWRQVPSTYLICENDRCVAPPIQEYMASQIRGDVERCAATHMVMLTMPEVVVDLVRRKAGEQV